MNETGSARQWIESEVQRLAPWYYAFDLQGVRTDATPPCDHHGHRRVTLPATAAPLLAGKTVLDVACNEGAYSFAALELGAASVHAFDARPINVEKARFVAQMRGLERLAFHVATCDGWLAAAPEPVDCVLMCGILYHLPEPWKTIRDYARLARESMFVTSALAGGADGYTPTTEGNTIASAESAEVVAMVPNTTETLLHEFAAAGFLPLSIAEERVQGFWGGCGVWLRNCGAAGVEILQSPSPGTFGVHLAPRPIEQVDGARSCLIDVVVHNRTPEARTPLVSLIVRTDDGAVLQRLGPQRIECGPRLPAARASCSAWELVRVALPGRGPLVLEVTARDAAAENAAAADTARVRVPAG